MFKSTLSLVYLIVNWVSSPHPTYSFDSRYKRRIKNRPAAKNHNTETHSQESEISKHTEQSNKVKTKIQEIPSNAFQSI